MVGNGNAKGRFVGVLKNLVASARVMDVKTGSLERPEDDPWFERGQFCVHAASTATFTVSLTGRSLIFLSEGIGSPSFRRLSR
jgi:hypothetical protein